MRKPAGLLVHAGVVGLARSVRPKQHHVDRAAAPEGRGLVEDRQAQHPRQEWRRPLDREASHGRRHFHQGLLPPGASRTPRVSFQLSQFGSGGMVSAGAVLDTPYARMRLSCLVVAAYLHSENISTVLYKNIEPVAPVLLIRAVCLKRGIRHTVLNMHRECRD